MNDIVVLYDGPVVTREEAKALGLKRYFTGNVCTRNHVDQRYSNNYGCVRCSYEVAKEWRKDNTDYLKEYNSSPEVLARKRSQYDPVKNKLYKEKSKTNPVSVAKIKESKRKYYLEHKEEIQKKNREDYWKNPNRRYSIEKALKKKEVIAGRQRPEICDVCKGSHHRGIVFDHCHSSGLFRGWICDRCNKVLGLVKDDIVLLDKLGRYLERFNGKVNNKTEKQDTDEGLCGAAQEFPH